MSGRMDRADIGLIGLAVMGQNLALNMCDHGIGVAVYNRTRERTDEFLAGPAKGTRVIGTFSLEGLAASLGRPRRVIMMVKAGPPVDELIGRLLPILEPGDIIIDAGNSNHLDTARRAAQVEAKGLLFVGCGVSGGEEGARRGPSIMPGGSPAAWPSLKPILQSIAAKVADGTPCCDWVGPGGSGHFVKTVHNGIEYGDMQLIGEAYDLMRTGLSMAPREIADVFARWNRGKLDSYLVGITADILAFTDADGAPMVDRILDAAGQKGTGKWTVEAAMEHGVPLTLIGEAVFARSLSALKDERMAAASGLKGPPGRISADRETFIADIGEALWAAKICSYTQGYMLLRAASSHFGWGLNYGGIARLWRGGCIIRAAFLDRIVEAFSRDAQLVNLLLAPFFKEQSEAAQASWRRVVARAAEAGLPLPAMSSALAFYDGYRRGILPANLLQAQRDYFGAHTYERVDRPRGEFFHSDWTGRGGSATSGSYIA